MAWPQRSAQISSAFSRIIPGKKAAQPRTKQVAPKELPDDVDEPTPRLPNKIKKTIKPPKSGGIRLLGGSGA